MSTSSTAARPADGPDDSSTGDIQRLPRFEKGRRLTPEEKDAFTEAVINAYDTRSIRGICEETGRSYGAIYYLLRSNGVTRRSKGHKMSAPFSKAGSS